MKNAPASIAPCLPLSFGLGGRVGKRPLALSILASCLFLSALPAQAQWKWRDKDGSITVSDRPPPKGIADKDILTRPPSTRRISLPTSASAAATGTGTAATESAKPDTPRNALEREVEARKRAAEQEQAAKTKAEETRLATQKAENCQRARGQQAALESGQRIARINEKGERQVLDDKGRADETRQAREVIASDCK